MMTSAHVAERTLLDLQWARIVERAQAACQSELGRQAIAALPFLADPAPIADTLAQVCELRVLVETVGTPPCGGLMAVEPVADRAVRQGVLEADEILAVADTLRAGFQLRRFLARHAERAPRVAGLAEGLPDREDVCRWVYSRFEPDGHIRDEASAALADARARVARLHARIRTDIESYLHEPAVENVLQDDFWTQRRERYVLPIKAQFRSQFPGIVHGASRTGQTVFIEPESLTRLNNELQLAEQDVEHEEYLVRREASDVIARAAADVPPAVRLLTQFDTLVARAILARDMDGAAPVLSTEGPLRLDACRNPLLLLKGSTVVPNDIRIGDGARVLVVSGPNAGGKTVTLHSLGLCQLMTQAGYLPPVGPDSCQPVFTEFFTIMGEQQSIERDLSTFSGALQQTNAILRRAGPRSLVLVDEIVVGTEPAQGAALAQAVLEALADRDVTTAVTTHYDALKTLAYQDPRFRNASVGLDAQTGRPNFRLSTGAPGSSSAIAIAQALGLPAPIIDRAREIVGERSLQFERVLQSLDAERQRLANETAALANERRTIERRAAEHAEATERIRRNAEALARQACQQTLDLTDRLRSELAEIQKQMKKDALTTGDVHSHRKRVAEIERRAHEAAPADPQAAAGAQGPPVALNELRPGLPVWIASLGRRGEVIEAPADPRRVAVLVGALRTVVAADVLHHPAAGAAPGAARGSGRVGAAPGGSYGARPASSGDLPPRTADNSCDVRGLRRDEAFEIIEKRLDQAMLSGQECLFVIHGHGSGALKAGVRDFLKHNRYGATWQPAPPADGGDGTTLVWLHLSD